MGLLFSRSKILSILLILSKKCPLLAIPIKKYFLNDFLSGRSYIVTA